MSNEFGEQVFHAVRDFGPIKNRDLQVAVLGAPAKDGYSRALDAALQRLRKAQRIAPSPKGWTLAEARPCSRCKGTGKEPCR